MYKLIYSNPTLLSLEQNSEETEHASIPDLLKYLYTRIDLSVTGVYVACPYLSSKDTTEFPTILLTRNIGEVYQLILNLDTYEKGVVAIYEYNTYSKAIQFISDYSEGSSQF